MKILYRPARPLAVAEALFIERDQNCRPVKLLDYARGYYADNAGMPFVAVKDYDLMLLKIYLALALRDRFLKDHRLHRLSLAVALVEFPGKLPRFFLITGKEQFKRMH